MSVIEYEVSHFDEYIRCVTSIGRVRKGKGRAGGEIPPVLWFRGHPDESWYLRPTLLREVSLGALETWETPIGTQSKRAMGEEMRKQHYIAKNYHYLEKKLGTDLEWMEVMQHHGVKTRLLDWTESVIHALLFALEGFFDFGKSKDGIPCVWVLDPIEWNKTAVEKILGCSELIDQCLDSLSVGRMSQMDGTRDEILKHIKYLSGHFGEYMEMEDAAHLRGIFNLSSIADRLYSLRQEELLYLLKEGEGFYCLFYMLNQLYLTSRPNDVGKILPLSIVEAYHCKRIQAQKGAFSIFPYYADSPAMQDSRSMGIYLDAMENMHDGNKSLYKILLCNPDEIAFEMLNAGLDISWLYPEMPVVANEIENRKVMI